MPNVCFTMTTESVRPHRRRQLTTTKAIIITKMRKGTHFLKLFITFEYYLSMVRCFVFSFSHLSAALCLSCCHFSLFRHSFIFPMLTLSLVRNFRDIFCPYTHSVCIRFCSFFISNRYVPFRSIRCLIFIRHCFISHYRFIFQNQFSIVHKTTTWRVQCAHIQFRYPIDER